MYPVYLHAIRSYCPYHRAGKIALLRHHRAKTAACLGSSPLPEPYPSEPVELPQLRMCFPLFPLFEVYYHQKESKYTRETKSAPITRFIP